MPTTRATKEVATHLGVSVGTMRNWSDQYADYLSETARPGHLPERRFTDHDLTVLTYIKQLRSEGLQAEQIRSRLDETTLATGEIITQQTTTEADKPQQTTELAPPDAQESTHSTPAPIVALDTILAIERRFEALERSQRHVVYYVAIGIGIGLALALVFELMALVASRVHGL